MTFDVKFHWYSGGWTAEWTYNDIKFTSAKCPTMLEAFSSLIEGTLYLRLQN